MPTTLLGLAMRLSSLIVSSHSFDAIDVAFTALSDSTDLCLVPIRFVSLQEILIIVKYRWFESKPSAIVVSPSGE
jgi:hypothetical protein